MNLYRLDYMHDDGVTTTPVRALLGGDFLTSSAKNARARAGFRAQDSLMPVLITRISGAGQMKRMKIAMPDGTFKVAA